MIYLTSYYIDGFEHGANVVAKDSTEAQLKCERRGINELVESKGSDNIPLEIGLESTLQDWIHYSCFIGFIAMKMGYEVDCVLGDKGFVHQFCHFDEMDLDEHDKHITGMIDIMKLCYIPVQPDLKDQYEKLAYSKEVDSD